MPAHDRSNQADYGPCLDCSQQLDLVAADRGAPCFSLPFLSFKISRNNHASEDEVSCRHCGFQTDLASYTTMLNQSTAIFVSKTVDTSTTISDDEVSVLSGYGLLNENIDADEPSIGEEYESLAGLLIMEKYYSASCKNCQASLSRTWRFCPNCGIFTEQIMSAFSYSEDGRLMRSQSEESFQHLLIEPQQKQICKTSFGTRNRPVSPRHEVGAILSIFRSNNPQADRWH